MQGPGGLLSEGRARSILDGEGKTATFNKGKHSKRTLQEAKEDVAYYRTTFGKEKADAILAYLES